MRLLDAFLALALLSMALPALLHIAVAEQQEPLEPSPTRIIVFFDTSQDAHFLWGYSLRILVVEDLVGSGGRCWKTLENGTTVMDTSVCRPVSNARMEIEYADLKERREVTTSAEGVAEASWRILSYPRASFVVRYVSSSGDLVEHRYTVESKPWTLAAVASFGAMVSSVVYVLRRGVW
ncbi:MAG: hypothetical protein QW420_02960 [Candidatus Caldarchaeum sp.]